MGEERYTDRIREIKKQQRRQAQCRRLIGQLIIILFVFLFGFLLGRGCGKSTEVMAEGGFEPVQTTLKIGDVANETKEIILPSYIDKQYLTINPYSRPGDKVKQVNAIVVHYIGNPGTTAQQNRNFFESLAETGDDYMSSNFVVGLEGEVIACVPLGEIAYASNKRNSDTVSIETCHPDSTGKFESDTYDSLVKLTAWLCKTYELDPLNGGVMRHHDVTGKFCPKYFVDNPAVWEQFKKDVQKKMESL